jgi:hypothetical protein
MLGVNINAYTARWPVALNLVIAVGATLLLRGAGKVDDTGRLRRAGRDGQAGASGGGADRLMA